MNFDDGFYIGRFFVSFIYNELFCGFSLRLGYDTDMECLYFSLQIAWMMLAIGWDMRKGGD